jgi:hypothetical protein
MLQTHPFGVRTAIAMALAFTAPIAAQKHADEATAQRAAFLSSPAWRTFLDAAGGEWSVDWCAATGTPGAIWGSGLPLADWRDNSLAEARRHAHELLRQHADLLGLGASEFREAIGARMHRVWTFTFDQHFRGLPVLGGRADVRVHMVGRVPMFGAKAVPIPADFEVVPSFDADTALAIAWQQLGAPTGAPQPARVAAPRVVIWSDLEAAAPQAPRLCWEVAVSNVDAEGRGPIGRYLVDARSGAVLRFVSDKHECGFDGCAVATPGGAAAATSATSAASLPPVNTTVTVQGWTRTGVDAFSALTNAPLPGLQLNVPGVGAVTTDGNGQFTVNIAAPVSIAIGALDGRHHGSIAGVDAPSGSFTVNPGVNTTIQLLTSAATTNEAAHTTTSYWTDKVNEYARSILGSTPELATASNIGVTVNIGATCNAYYTGNTMNFYQAGGGCSNTANATVIAHEWGHGIDERYGGISNTTGDGLSEGWGDIFGMYLCDTPNLGSGFQTPNSPLRSGNNATQFPCSGCGVHSSGQSWMGFAWKLRDRIATTLSNRPAAIALTNDIVISTIAANAANQTDAVREVYIADDNDGNLANGTPNKPDLDWACNQHSLPIPGSGGGGGGGGGGGPTNNECATAIAIGNGVSGPYTTVGATTSSPAWPCASGGNDVWFTYTAYQSGTLTVTTCSQATWDTAIQIFAGDCATIASVGCIDDSCGLQSTLSVPVAPGVYSIRVGGYGGATGTFNLDVSGPAATPATASVFGTGCYTLSRAFYEQFPAGSFDLASSAMQLAYDPAGFYVASAAGGYVAPTAAATVLALGDDTVTTVTLATPLAYPGGTTTTLEVCSNGFVSPVAGNGVSYTPTAAGWLGSAQARWGCWHDWNPGAAGSGAVKFEQIGSTSYVTWDGVYSFGAASPATFQLQFHRPSGNVTFAWGIVNVVGNGWLVGFAAAQPNADLGNRDISATLPGSFTTSALNLLPLALASSLPQLGSTLTLTTTNFTAAAPVGIQVLGTAGFDPGIDLTGLGMPGCFQYAAPTVLNTIGVTAGASTFTLAIPNDPALMGYALYAQSAGFAIGANTAGIVTSNGVALTLGV